MPTSPPASYQSWLRDNLPPQWTADAPHIKLISEHLDAVTRGEIDRLAIHCPPRHSKSETTSVRYPLYRLQRDPQLACLVTGYNERFARRLSRKTRNLAAERGLVTQDKSAADEWQTTTGGLFMARGVGSPPTGTGFDLILIDDPVRRREDADSSVFREKAWDWYTDDLLSRLEPGGAIILVATLWHEDDICARAVASEPGGWTVLKLPALAEPGDALGRPLGAALWPERFPVEALERIKAVMVQNEGVRSWEALFQQNPTPREGSFFKVAAFEYCDPHEVPPLLQQTRAWDIGATEGAGDPSAGVLMGVAASGRYYVEDVTAGQWATDRRNAVIRQTAERDGKQVLIRGPQDPGAAGKDTALAFVRLLAGYSVRTAPVTGDKQVRADPFSAQVNAGNVTLVRGPWVSGFVEELRQFPMGKHDDQVDASSLAFASLARGPRPEATAY